MSFALQQLLGYVALGKPIEKVKNGIPDPLPEFSSIKGSPAIADKKRFMTYRGTRKVARRAEYDAPHLRGTNTPVGEQDVICLSAKELLPVPGSTLIALRSLDKYQQDMGKDWLAITTRNFTTRFDNLRKAQRWQMLAGGKNWFNAAGDLLPSSSGAVLTIDVGIAATHLDQANGIIDLAWSNSQANIPLHIQKLNQQAAFQTGYDLEVALYGQSIPSFLSTNDYAMDYLARNPRFNDAFTFASAGAGPLPDGLFGIKRWIPTNKAFYEDADGTNRQIFADDSLVLCPLPNQDWCEEVEGTTMVPTTFNATADVAGALDTALLESL